MPSFAACYPIIKENEGGWVLDPEDPGGETFRGVTRRDWPWLAMWSHIDAAKDNFMKLAPSQLSDASWEVIDASCKFVAEHGYWNRVRGVDLINQSLANMLCDSAYLNGVHQASKFLQRGLNKMNRVGTLYLNLAEDGGIGKITLRSLKIISRRGELKRLFALIKAYRITFYSELMESAEYREKYPGWIDRSASFLFQEEPA